MAWLRYLLYFLLITLIMALLTQLEIAYPGSLRLQVFMNVNSKAWSTKPSTPWPKP